MTKMNTEKTRMLTQSVGVILLTSVFLTGLAGCRSHTSDRDLVYLDPAEAQEAVKPEKGYFELGDERQGVWIDPRSPKKFVAGHIPGAINVPYKDLANQYDQLTGYSPIIIYGEAYGDILAEAMTKSLLQHGAKEVHVLRGGLRAWEKAGNPVAREDATSAEELSAADGGGSGMGG